MRPTGNRSEPPATGSAGIGPKSITCFMNERPFWLEFRHSATGRTQAPGTRRVRIVGNPENGSAALARAGAPASRKQGSRSRDATDRESGAVPSSAGVASVSGVTSPKGAPVPPSDGAPASREQGSRLRDANVRESGAALSSAGVASVSGVTSPKGAPVPPSDGAPSRHPLFQELAPIIREYRLPLN